MSDSEDEDLKRAIALSLQANSPTKPTVIDLISDDEDDDLDAPLQLKGTQNNSRDANEIVAEDIPAPTATKQGEGQKKVFPSSKIETRQAPDMTSMIPSPLFSSMLGMNRPQMEAERLARLQQKKQREEEAPSESFNLDGLAGSKKRKASISGSVSGSQDGRQVKAKYSTQWTRTAEEIAAPRPELLSQLSSGGSGIDAPLTQDSWPLTQDSRPLTFREPKSARDTSRPSTCSNKRPAPEVLSFNQQQALQEPGVRYPKGVVKRTWVRGCPMEDDTIKIEEVFQKNTLDLAMLSTFQVDPDWVSTKLLDKTKVIWVLNARHESEVSSIPVVQNI